MQDRFYRDGLRWRGRTICCLDSSCDPDEAEFRSYLRGAVFPGTKKLRFSTRGLADHFADLFIECEIDRSVKGVGHLGEYEDVFEIEFDEDLGVEWHVASATPNCVVARRGDEVRVTYHPGRPEESHWKAKSYENAVVMVAREKVVTEAEAERVVVNIYPPDPEDDRWIR